MGLWVRGCPAQPCLHAPPQHLCQQLPPPVVTYVHWQPWHTWGCTPQGVRQGVGKDSVGPCGPSDPMTVASESDHGSSYASPSDPSMIASQSPRHHCLFGSTSSSGSICPAPSSLSSFCSVSVSMVCGSGCRASSSSNVEELLGKLTIRWAPSLVIQAALLGCIIHNSLRPWWTSPKPR